MRRETGGGREERGVNPRLPTLPGFLLLTKLISDRVGNGS